MIFHFMFPGFILFGILLGGCCLYKGKKTAGLSKRPRQNAKLKCDLVSGSVP